MLGAAKVSENAEGQCAPSVGLILSPQIPGSEHTGPRGQVLWTRVQRPESMGEKHVATWSL